MISGRNSDEDRVHLGPVPDVPDHREDLRRRPAEAIHQVEELGLVDIEQGRRARLELEHRPGQLAPDGAAGPGDEHPLPVHEGADGREIDLDLLPPQQVLDPDLLDIGERDVPVDEVEDAGEDLDLGRAAGVPDDLHHGPDVLGTNGRDGDQHFVDRVRLQHRGDIVPRPQDPDAVDAHPLLGQDCRRYSRPESTWISC